MKNPYDVIRKPVLTERAGILSEAKDGKQQYVFNVAINANKIEIAQAIESIYNVKVKSVNTIRVKGKAKRQGHSEGHRADWKKAFVVLADGQKINIV